MMSSHYPPGAKVCAYCPHCNRDLLSSSIGASHCPYCKNPIIWPKQKEVKAKKVIMAAK